MPACLIPDKVWKYSKEKAKENRPQFASLSRQVLVLEQKVSESPTEEIVHEYQQIKEEIEFIVTQEAQSLAFRSKAQY